MKIAQPHPMCLGMTNDITIWNYAHLIHILSYRVFDLVYPDMLINTLTNKYVLTCTCGWLLFMHEFMRLTSYLSSTHYLFIF